VLPALLTHALLAAVFAPLAQIPWSSISYQAIGEDGRQRRHEYMVAREIPLGLGRVAAELLAATGVPSMLHPNRGFNHGAWVPLSKIYPEADIPVVTASVNQALDPADWFKLGQAMAPLRSEGVMVIGSGVTVHNFRALDWNRMDDPTPMEWAGEGKAAKLLHLSWRGGWRPGAFRL
jgi:hypothetical protein